MKILAVSDVIDHLVQSPAIAERFADVDLVLGCGDLPFGYMEYIVTMLGKRMYHVYGNHAQDVITNAEGQREERSPGGCINIHRRVVNHCGLLIGGLEGSVRYNQGGHQYSQRQMRLLAHSMAPGLLCNQVRYGRAIDILITHAPPWGIHDADDLPHHGFKAYLDFMDRWSPRYLIHGHMHLYRLDAPRETCYKDTTVLNTYSYQVIEIDAPEGKEADACPVKTPDPQGS
jgi:uncharacterized protein